MTDRQMLDKAVGRAVKITVASRKFRKEATYPRVVQDGDRHYVEFYANDRRFGLYEAHAIYVQDYLEENGFAVLGPVLNNENHVRELIEIITS